MTIKETGFKDLFILTPKIYQDGRGYFFESYNHSVFKTLTGLDIDFVQDNQAQSSRFVLRGIHFQLAPKAQSKLIRVLSGRIWDVVVDLRKGSTTFGQWFGIELSEDNQQQLFIPKGFGHGYSVLSDEAVVAYKCDEYYHPASELGILFNDEQLDIDWKIDLNKAIISEKDQQWSSFDSDKIYFQ